MRIAVSFIVALLLSAITVESCFAGRLLVIESVEVRKTKDNGKAWDAAGGLPDLRVSVERTSKPAGEKHITAPRKNNLKPEFNRTAIEVDDDDELELVVLDEDVGADDEAGRVERRFTSEELKSGKLELSFGQVVRLTLRFK